MDSESELLARATELLALEEMPARLASAFASLDAEHVRRRGRNDAFAPVEQAWHLADLEEEGFGERIRLLLAEDNPQLPDFDGARIAAERDYRNRSLDEALYRFASARAANLAQLRALGPAQWQRRGVQQGVGPLRLADLPARMHAHDASHIEEIRTWFAHAGLAAPWRS